ncbi:MAG: hypothetical protein IPM81_12035 [Saprospirales bacterium]|nr:hypothetical protein [Saprospirales bacterium]
MAQARTGSQNYGYFTGRKKIQPGLSAGQEAFLSPAARDSGHLEISDTTFAGVIGSYPELCCHGKR